MVPTKMVEKEKGVVKVSIPSNRGNGSYHELGIETKDEAISLNPL